MRCLTTTTNNRRLRKVGTRPLELKKRATVEVCDRNESEEIEINLPDGSGDVKEGSGGFQASSLSL